MPPTTTSTCDDPGSRARARPPGARRAFLSALTLAVLVLAVAPAIAQTQSCLPGCDPMNFDSIACCPPCLGSACAGFDDCKEDYRAFVEDCVQRRCDARGTAGRCTITLDCVRQCRVEGPTCTKRVRRLVEDFCPDCRIGRGAARRACNRCFGSNDLAPACAGTGSEGSGSACQRQCIRRQSLVVDCYQKCRERCDGDLCAVHICERACRDATCGQLRSRCSLENETGGEPAYLACCDREGDCDGDGAATISCEPTTTTTTSSSTTSSSSTTVQTVSTTTTSTTLTQI